MSAIKEVLERYVEPEGFTRSEGQRRERLARIREKQSQLKTEKRSLLPLEEEARSALDAKLTTLQGEERCLKKEGNQSLRRIDLQALKLRDEKGYPKLAVFALNNPSFTINRQEVLPAYQYLEHETLWWPRITVLLSMLAGGGIGALTSCLYLDHNRDIFTPFWKFSSPLFQILTISGMLIGGAIKFGINRHRLDRALPNAIRICFEDVRKRLYERWAKEQNFEFQLRTRFAGVIPGPVREEIKKTRGNFKQVLLIAEPQSWELQKLAVDPIVAGWDGANLWFITSFDLTSIETYVANEFTS